MGRGADEVQQAGLTSEQDRRLSEARGLVPEKGNPVQRMVAEHLQRRGVKNGVGVTDVANLG